MRYREIQNGDNTIVCTEKLDIFIKEDGNQKAMEDMGGEEFSRYAYSPVTPKKLKKLIILLSSACNLRCRYCYLSFGMHPGEEVIKNISVEDAKKAIEMIYEKYPEGIGFIQFFGGEPLVAFKEMKAIYEFTCEFFDAKGLKRPNYGVVTNGVLLNEEVISFFNESKMSVTISIDGDKAVHDNVRKKAGPGSAYDDLIEKVRKFKDEIRFPLFYEMTLNREHVLGYEKGKMRQWLESIKECGFTRGIIGAVEYSMDKSLNFREEDLPVLQEIYKEYVEYYFDELTKEQTDFYNLDICKLIGMITKKDLTFYSCNTGISQMTLATNGTIYPCPKFATVDMPMGSVKTGKIDQTQIRKIIEEDKRDLCKSCWMVEMCKSYCYSLEYRKALNKDEIAVRCIHLDNMISNVIRELVNRRNDPDYDQIIRKAARVFAA